MYLTVDSLLDPALFDSWVTSTISRFRSLGHKILLGKEIPFLSVIYTRSLMTWPPPACSFIYHHHQLSNTPGRWHYCSQRCQALPHSAWYTSSPSHPLPVRFLVSTLTLSSEKSSLPLLVQFMFPSVALQTQQCVPV